MTIVQTKVVQIMTFTLTRFSSQIPISRMQLLTDLIFKVLVANDTSTMPRCNSRAPIMRVPDLQRRLDRAVMVSELESFSSAMWIGMAEELAPPFGARAADAFKFPVILQLANVARWVLQDLSKHFACMLCQSDIYTIRVQRESCTHRRAITLRGPHRCWLMQKGPRPSTSAVPRLQPSTQLPSRRRWRGSEGCPESHYNAVTQGTTARWKSNKISD